MAVLKPYLTFHGNCREAFTHYHLCLGGELGLLTVGAAQSDAEWTVPLSDKVLEATLSTHGFTLLGTDLVSEHGLAHGNAVSVFLECEQEEELKALFVGLATGGTVTQAPTQNLLKAWMASITDRFGVHWLLRAPSRQGHD
jgi:PhnB protein